MSRFDKRFCWADLHLSAPYLPDVPKITDPVKRRGIGMNVDSYFTVGRGHEVCQDYAIAKIYGQESLPGCWHQHRPYLIVSDGCSGSPQTDVGARILAHMAEKLVCESYAANSMLSWESFGIVTIAQAQVCAKAMGLPLQCLDATLLVGFEKEAENNGLTIYMYGDGHVLGISSDKKEPTLSCLTIKYDHSAPYYLTYTTDMYRRDAYRKEGINRHEILNWTESEKDGSAEIKYLNSAEAENVHFRSYDEYKYIALGSDGLGAFMNSQTGESYEDQMVMDSFLNFKNTKGEFVKRRVKRAMRDLEREQHIVPGDDVSLAVLQVNDS